MAYNFLANNTTPTVVIFGICWWP